MPHAVGRPERKAVEDDLASMFDFLAEHAPAELAAWVRDVRRKGALAHVSWPKLAVASRAKRA